MPIISSKNLTKTFTKTNFDWRRFHFDKTEKFAVNKLDVEIEEGEFVGFLGPNGAGKTTFLKMLAGIIHPTSGEAKVLGFTPWERNFKYLEQISIVMGQKNQLWWDLPAIDSYLLMREIYSIPTKRYKENLDRMVEMLDMKGIVTQRLRNMSLGERMKCELVACFLHDPKVIFLDEPTIGLDVVSAQSIRTFLKEINQEKKCTIILTSHYMADIEALCKRVVIINKGLKIYDGLLDSLREKYAPEKRIEIFLPTIEDREKFAHISGKKNLSGSLGVLHVDKNDLPETIKTVFKSFNIENISISDADTEEVISKIFLENKSN